MKKTILIISAVLIIMLSLSCSNGTNPLVPSNSTGNPQSEFAPDVSNGTIPSDSAKVDNRGVFGAWRVVLDPATLTAEMVPARNAQGIGLIVDSDLSQFLTVTPCSDCMSIARFYQDGYENYALELKMKHPFPNGAARPDLHGFDVRAIFIMYYSDPTVYTGINVMRPGAVSEPATLNEFNTGLLNADGYTSHYDELTTDSRYFIGGTDIPGNLNPYLRFFEDDSDAAFDPLDPQGHNVMPTGSNVYTRTAILQKDTLNRLFEMYIVADVAYGQSAVFANRQNPQYYLPAFNRTEPWRVEYWIANNNLKYNDAASTAEVMVQVFDWQHNATVDPNYPDPANLDGMPVSSKVTQLELYIPKFQNNPIIVTAPESGSGTPSDPLLYKMTVTNQNTWSSNTYGLLAVRDELYGHTGRLPIPPTPAGFPYATLDILDYAFYTWIAVNIKYPGMVVPLEYIVNTDLYFPWDDMLADKAGAVSSTTIHPYYFPDPSHEKYLYQWDYDYNGVDFAADSSGAPSPNIEFANGGKKNVGLKISTASAPPREYTYNLPVWAEGIAYQADVLPTGASMDSASWTRNHAMAATSDHFYFVYTRTLGGQRDIMLTIVDVYGNSTTGPITNTANASFAPSICVIEEGTRAGIYIAYSEYDGVASFMYATYGNLDGTGFDPSHVKRVSPAPNGTEFMPVLLDFNDQLHVYYNYLNGGQGRILGAHSDDYGLTWVFDGWVTDNGAVTPSQAFFSAVVCWGDVRIVWEDGINFTDYGSDLYMGTSTDGLTFTTIDNISSFRGKINETYPSVSARNGDLAIAFQVYFPGDTKRTTYVKTIDSSKTRMTTTPIDLELTGNVTHTAPSIVTTEYGSYKLAFGHYDFVTSDLTQYVLDLNIGDTPGSIYWSTVLEQVVGNVPAEASQTWNGMAEYKCAMNASQTFAVWRNTVDSYLEVATFPVEQFGEAEYMSFVAEEKYYIF
jgi:hypothetical protein